MQPADPNLIKGMMVSLSTNGDLVICEISGNLGQRVVKCPPDMLFDRLETDVKNYFRTLCHQIQQAAKEARTH